MALTRRNMLALSSAALAATGFGALPAFASLAEDEIATLTGGADAVAGDLSITAPEIAENGNTVPIEVSAPGAVMDSDAMSSVPLVTSVMRESV